MMQLRLVILSSVFCGAALCAATVVESFGDTPTNTPQQTPAVAPAVAPTAAPLPAVTIRDEKTLLAELVQINDDQVVRASDDKARPRAVALMTEGVAQLAAKNFDQALANFLEAYSTFPSPRILLNIGSTLRDMGRLADAANTYQRYLVDPGSGMTRASEVKVLLDELDATLTILVLRVAPAQSELSIDGGPFITVESTFMTRVRQGLHVIRLRKTGRTEAEVTLNGFPGERKNLDLEVPAPRALEAPQAQVVVQSSAPAPLEPTGSTTILLLGGRKRSTVNGWLVSGTGYQAEPGERSYSRRVRKGYGGAVVAAIVPPDPFPDQTVTILEKGPDPITAGISVQTRLDFINRGAAAALGVAYPLGRHLELDGNVLLSNFYGGYVGARYRLLTEQIRPFVAVGIPTFYADKLRIGGHVSGGVEFAINSHFSALGSVCYEHFFNADATVLGNYFLPVLGVIGRL